VERHAFRLIAEILRHPSCEVLVNFMYEEVNRFLTHDAQPANFDDLNAQPPERIPPFSSVLVEPPDRARAARPVATFTPVRIDFVRRDAENRVLGMHGEEFVFELERRRLHDDARRPDLSKKVRWRSRDDGDGLGRHPVIRAHGQRPAHRGEDDGRRDLHTRFALTQNELERSRQSAQAYHLYRVFEFGQSPKLYMLRGALDEVCDLTPAVYRASVARTL
jgi:hypothetical protein